MKKSGAEADLHTLRRMNDCVSHRGPDADGLYCHGPVGFGHRRLSILDLSDLGAQPMKLKDRYVITYNGEVYNYIEVRTELQAAGYAFKGGSDTEVILAAYDYWGEDCVHHFNGMWAMAIHDLAKQTVFLSRDRFGVKPVYYHETEDALYFGSEIRQMLILKQEQKVNKQILFDYLFLGFHHHSNETFFDGIYSLDPGHNLMFNLDSGEWKIEKWYTLKMRTELNRMSWHEAQKEFTETINRSIHLRLRSDVKVGTCLSGGLDSSYIATVAAKAYNQATNEKFNAITAKSVDAENDESDFARQVVEQAGLNWKITNPTADDFFEVLEDVIRTQEEPFGSPSVVMQYFVMKKAKEEGCIVLLDGQGGDEVLLGYDRYYAAYINQQSGILKKVRAFIATIRNSKLSVKDLLFYYLYFNSADIRAKRQLRRNSYVKSGYKKYLNTSLLKRVAEAGKSVSELQHHEITRVQLQKLLRYEDKNSMRFSIETRVPFVDFNVVELGYSLPFSYKMHDGWSKFILRKSGEDVMPSSIVWRKNKFGFESPNKTWLKDRTFFLDEVKRSEFVAEFVDIEKIPSSLDEISLWKLYNIAVWAKIFNVKF